MKSVWLAFGVSDKTYILGYVVNNSGGVMSFLNENSKAWMLTAGFFLAAQSFPSHSEVIFQDDFSGGNLSKTQSGAQWGPNVSVSVVSSPSIVNENSARFSYDGSSDLSKDAFSELRFDLGKLYPELWLQFHLHVPANYEHRDAQGTDNNKILRLWGASYNDNEKLGLSTWLGSSGSSQMIADWNRQGQGIGPKGQAYSSFITSADRGKWMKVRVQVIAASSSTRPGTIKVWKNDELVIDNHQIVDNYASGEPHAYRYGYLLGWSNSGFNVNTDFHVDGVVFATSSADLNGEISGQSPPNPPKIDVQ